MQTKLSSIELSKFFLSKDAMKELELKKLLPIPVTGESNFDYSRFSSNYGDICSECGNLCSQWQCTQIN